MLQQIQPWLPRLLILVQWMFGLAIAYVIANTGLILMGESGSESNSTAKASQVVNSTQSMPPAPSLNSLIQRDLFGQSDSIGTASASAPTTPTRLPLNLRAVFVSTDPGQSTAIISQRNNSGKLYSPGICFPAAQNWPQ
jgi:type II secretory pathway component PulC